MTRPVHLPGSGRPDLRKQQAPGPRSERMTGLDQWQVTELVADVFVLLGGWQRPRGRRVIGLYRAVVLTLFLLRHDNAQHVAWELFGCSQSRVSRIFRRVRPLLDTVAAWRTGHVSVQALPSAVLVDGFIVPTGEPPPARADLFSGKHRVAGIHVQVVADLGGRLLDTGAPVGGSRHDTVAFLDSGIAARWAAHLADDGPGMLADKGLPGLRTDHPVPQTAWPAAVRSSQEMQHRVESPTRCRRTRHLSPGQLEDSRHRLPRTTVRDPRSATHSHQPGDLPSLGIRQFEYGSRIRSSSEILHAVVACSSRSAPRSWVAGLDRFVGGGHTGHVHRIFTGCEGRTSCTCRRVGDRTEPREVTSHA